MPTYQYACTECNHAFEQAQSFSDDSLTECPACTGRLRKIFNAVGVVFKGSGFYRTDNRPEPKSANGSESGSSDSSSDSSSGTATKTDAKPEAGSKSKTTSEGGSATKTETKAGSKSGSRDSSTV